MSNKRSASSPIEYRTSKRILCEMEEYIKQIAEQNAQVIKDNQAIINELKQHNVICDRNLKEVNLNVSRLDSRVILLERVSTLKSINILGVPPVENEKTADLYKIVKKICGFVKVTVSERDMDDIFRFGKEKKSIRVDFVSKLKKREMINAMKTKEVKGSDVGISESPQIFVFEHLLHATHKIHIEAKKLKREGLVKFVWVKDGKVLLREAEGEPVIIVKSLADLLKFKADK